MMKKMLVTITALLVLLAFVVVIIFTNNHSPQDELQNVLDPMGNILDDTWKKLTVTEVSDLIYFDDKGNMIVYYLCETTYHEEYSNTQTGVNTDAIAAVINPNEAKSSRECAVGSHPAIIYQKEGRAYLCWTIMPELSCVIKYDPSVESEADVFRMAESVPANKR